MSSIADTPLDILHNCSPHVYGEMWHEIHQELRVRATLSDLGGRNRKYIVPLTAIESARQRYYFLTPPFKTYLNGIDDSAVSHLYQRFQRYPGWWIHPTQNHSFVVQEVLIDKHKDMDASWDDAPADTTVYKDWWEWFEITGTDKPDLFVPGEGPWVHEIVGDRDRISYVSHFSLAVRRHAVFRLFKLMFPQVTFQPPMFSAYKIVDRPFTLMLTTPFYQSCALYVHRGQGKPFFARELIHRPGMVTLFDAFMDSVNRSHSLRYGIWYWRDIQTWKDGSIHLYTKSRDIFRY